MAASSVLPISPNAWAKSRQAPTSANEPKLISKNRRRSALDDLLLALPSASVSTEEAMASVVLNVAEGNARRSSSERRRFFEIARASLAEVGACIDLSHAFGLIGQEKFVAYKSRLHDISRMLWGLMR